ncbi:MAG TPA: peptidase S58 family protein [Trueperaceae bacterium]|nr:peptidase S58 family protein [Trueperaceae bacterium]
MTANSTITAIDGLQVGHYSDFKAQTGCTVLLCPPQGCLASGFVLGSAPGGREISLLQPEKSVDRIDAIVLSGGSAFGLEAAGGVMRYLKEQNRGFETPFGPMPIVPSAVIYDLPAGSSEVYPTAESGIIAAKAASTKPVELGRVGVGSGALVGKYLGFEHCSYGAIGSAVMNVGDAKVAALVVTNAVGDIVDPDSGKIIAGSSRSNSNYNIDSLLAFAATNTTLAIVATDAIITKAQAYALSQTAHIGIARVTRPSHTIYDGDTSFAISTQKIANVPLMALSVAVQEVVAKAIIKGVKIANKLS